MERWWNQHGWTEAEKWQRLECGQLRPQDKTLILRVYPWRVFYFRNVLKGFDVDPNI